MKSDYEGFVLHVDEWERKNVAYNRKDLEELAEKYHTPIPVECIKKVKK